MGEPPNGPAIVAHNRRISGCRHDALMDVGRLRRAIRALRVRRGWRQEDLASRAGIARPVVGRIERGERSGLTVDAVDAVAEALGASVDLNVRWRGEVLDRMLDEAHARLVELVVRRLRDLGWEVAVEVTFSAFGERGSIDVLAVHPARRALVVIEVKSVVPDAQAMLAGLDRKGRLAPELAAGRAWDVRSVARVLVIWDTRTNRRRLERVGQTVRALLPGGSRDVQRWLRDPAGPAVSGVWFVPDARHADAIGVRRQRVRLPRT
jgi:transcriptional regulator with XRE-family HTH domain